MNVLLVGLGAAIGGMSRYGIMRLISKSDFPWATVVINLSGSFLLGVVAAVWAKDHPMRLLLGVGILGGFTTFSTFTLDLVEQLRSNQPLAALMNVGIQVLGGLALCALGYSVAAKFPTGG